METLRIRMTRIPAEIFVRFIRWMANGEFSEARMTFIGCRLNPDQQMNRQWQYTFDIDAPNESSLWELGQTWQSFLNDPTHDMDLECEMWIQNQIDEMERAMERVKKDPPAEHLAFLQRLRSGLLKRFWARA